MQGGDDNDDGSSRYFFRKRLKTNNYFVERSPYPRSNSHRTKTPIAFVPTDVLQKIMSYVSNEDLAKTLRLVNNRFKYISQDILNHKFKSLEHQLSNVKYALNAILEHSTEEDKVAWFCKKLNIAEVLELNYSQTHSTIWRYIDQHVSVRSLCMYGGRILDLYEKLLRWLATDPNEINSRSTYDNYCKDVVFINYYTKKFVIHFDRFSEQPINLNPSCSGCKLLDILDSASDVHRTVQYKVSCNDVVEGKIIYHFSNTWFVAFKAKRDTRTMWNKKQRFMYLRLRRIVNAHSIMMTKSKQFKRELRMRNFVPINKKPRNSIYSGGGMPHNTFFYYGVMNSEAYTSNLMMHNLSRNFPKRKCLGVRIMARFLCTKNLAPYKILKDLDDNDERHCKLRVRKKETYPFEMSLKFYYRGAQYDRLPTKYKCKIKQS